MFIKTVAALAAFAAATIGAAQADGRLQVQVGFSELIRMSTVPSNIIIGDPRIADINLLERSPHIILSGRAHGTTNMLVLDERGNELINAVIEVGPVRLAPGYVSVSVIDRVRNVRRYVCNAAAGCQQAGQTRSPGEAATIRLDEEIQRDDEIQRDEAPEQSLEDVPVS